MQICCSSCSVILNVTATQCTCSLNSVYHPTSTVMSSLFTHARSRPLSLAARLHECSSNHSHINNEWTSSGQISYTNIVCYPKCTIHHVFLNKRTHRKHYVFSTLCVLVYVYSHWSIFYFLNKPITLFLVILVTHASWNSNPLLLT